MEVVIADSDDRKEIGGLVMVDVFVPSGCHRRSDVGFQIILVMILSCRSMIYPRCAVKTARYPESQSRPTEIRVPVSSLQYKTSVSQRLSMLTVPVLLAHISTSCAATPIGQGVIDLMFSN